jgi:hypothetical protein
MGLAKGAPVGALSLRNYNGYSPGHASILSGEAIHRRPHFPKISLNCHPSENRIMAQRALRFLYSSL